MKSLCCFAYFSRFFAKKTQIKSKTGSNTTDDDTTTPASVEEIPDEEESQEQAANMIANLAGVNVNINKSNQTIDYPELYNKCFGSTSTSGVEVDISQLETVIGTYCVDPDISKYRNTYRIYRCSYM